jgi:hypothetical protein
MGSAFQMEFSTFLNNLTGIANSGPKGWLEKEIDDFIESINPEVRDTLERALQEIE